MDSRRAGADNPRWPASPLAFSLVDLDPSDGSPPPAPIAFGLCISFPSPGPQGIMTSTLALDLASHPLPHCPAGFQLRILLNHFSPPLLSD